MLYDERWGKETKTKTKTKTETEVKPTKTEIRPWQVILSLAADDLEVHGWIQGDYANAIGGHCALGAIRTVGGTIVERYEAEAHLADHIRMPVAYWNDHPARTKEEVVAKLREVAKVG